MYRNHNRKFYLMINKSGPTYIEVEGNCSKYLWKHRESYEATEKHATWEAAEKLGFLNLGKLDPLNIKAVSK